MPDTNPPARSRRALTQSLGLYALTAVIVVVAVWQGLRLRRWTWEITQGVHFFMDIERGYGWGVAGSGPEGYPNLYEKMAHEKPDWPLWLDYAPLRLGVMTLWGHYNRGHQPNFQRWHTEYAFNAPVLTFNTVTEAIGCVAAFLIVRKVVRDSASGPPAVSRPREWFDRLRRRPPAGPPMVAVDVPVFRGWWPGLLAALLLWFNPCLIFNAHGYPTWDVWVVPMYLLAVLAAVYDAWLTAGVLLAVGVMFKGQQLVGAPVFVAWTLLNGRWLAALRFGCGFFIAFAAIASPWLLTYVPQAQLDALYEAQAHVRSSYDFAPFVAERLWNRPAIGWALTVALVAGLVPLWRRVPGRWNWTAAVGGGLVTLWPLVLRWPGSWGLQVIGLAIAVPAIAAVVRGVSWRAILVLTSSALALLLAMPLFGASRAWWDCGLMYGTVHWPEFVVGLTDNLPALLHNRFGWGSPQDVWFTLPGYGSHGPTPVTMGIALKTLMALTMLPCLWAVARHARRRDRRLLVALVGPWLMFFCFPPQIHERYLLYAAATSCLLVGESLGMTLLGLLLTVLAWVQLVHVLTSFNGLPGQLTLGANLHALKPDWFAPSAGVTLHRVLSGTFPDAAWAVLLIGMIYLYRAVRSSPENGRDFQDFGRQPDAAAVQPGVAPATGADGSEPADAYRRRQYG